MMSDSECSSVVGQLRIAIFNVVDPLPLRCLLFCLAATVLQGVNVTKKQLTSSDCRLQHDLHPYNELLANI